ncbi:Reticulocalbin-1 [Fasciola hepatica]|uniref:Reticulocalbin-3 n=1 Tax=Fasciola hepatica TaxID=6192 RepID=A0A4E0RT35_FASHE|nr:Reticulocalbin-1 [Fasciola hepatica]
MNRKPPQKSSWAWRLLIFWISETLAVSNENLDLFINDQLQPEDDLISNGAENTFLGGSSTFSFDHQAILGTHEQAMQFRQLEPEEAKKRLARLVERMDTNQDGAVNKEELVDWIVHSFKLLDLESSRQRLKDRDENSDGAVSWAEYLHKTFGYSELEMDELKKNDGPETQAFVQSVEHEKVKFDSADLDKNGLLNETEYAAFEYPHNYPHMAPYEIIQTLKDFDRDKDEFISEEEYLQDSKMQPEALQIEKANFKRYDKNGDGKLDKEELVNWVTPGFERTAVSEAEHLIMETDSDKDGQLSKDEILRQHELWVGSQATDYGRHLEQMPRDEL